MCGSQKHGEHYLQSNQVRLFAPMRPFKVNVQNPLDVVTALDCLSTSFAPDH
ncbi:hypothetical protein NT05HA_2057 [Aggregatibacter aphrophilus NJ8700]|nr:hypothetical protein NT05HA_2057 [Aggregatibacter aphrophilus NJ8700]